MGWISWIWNIRLNCSDLHIADLHEIVLVTILDSTVILLHLASQCWSTFSQNRIQPIYMNLLDIYIQGLYKGRSGSQLTFTKGSSRLILTTDPLRIDIFSDDNPVVSINARGLLNFEHTREKKWVCSCRKGDYTLIISNRVIHTIFVVC